MARGLAAGLGLLAALPAAAFPTEPPDGVPQFTNATVHDPSLIPLDDEYYVFGSHLASAKTADWQHWTQITTDTTVTGGNALVPDAGAEFAEAIGYVGENQAFFAPDVIRLPDGRFYYYYCIGRLDLPRAALGLAIADDIEGPYVDQGVILRSGQFGQPSEDGTVFDATVHPNAIDPDVFYDNGGRLWMVYGSYSGGIFILELDETTGLPLPDQGYGKKLTGGNHARIEGAYIIYSPESHYYYLFLSFGGLAADGGYNVRIGRSHSPDGPYFDAAGNDLIAAAGAPGTLFDDESIEPYGVKLMGNWQFRPTAGEPLQDSTGYVSPGHNSAYYDARTGKYFLVFHSRFVGRGEAHEVRVHQMYLNEDDWLVAAPHKYAGESLGWHFGFQVAGDYKVINHSKEITPEVRESSVVTLKHNRRIGDGGEGYWWLRGGRYLTIHLDGVRYRGVFNTQWDDDQGAWVFAFSATSADGVSLWGSRVIDSRRPPRNIGLPPVQPQYGEEFTMSLPQPHGWFGNDYSYSIVTAPEGVSVDRATGELTWQPGLLDAGLSQVVTVRALNTLAGTRVLGSLPNDEVLYTFDARATSPTVLNRRDVAFSSAAASGLQDAEGTFTGLTARLPGTGTMLPPQDPNLQLDPGMGTLGLATTQGDFNGGAGLATTSAPGLSLSELGLTGSGDFAVRAVIRPLPDIELIDQVGLYVGANGSTLTRAGTIVFGAPEYFSSHTDVFDFGGRFFGFGFDGSDGMTVTISRHNGQWRYLIDGIDWTPAEQPTFLNGLTDLTAGVYAVTPLNANVKVVDVDEVTAVVATDEPCPVPAGADDTGCAQ